MAEAAFGFDSAEMTFAFCECGATAAGFFTVTGTFFTIFCVVVASFVFARALAAVVAVRIAGRETATVFGLRAGVLVRAEVVALALVAFTGWACDFFALALAAAARRVVAFAARAGLAVARAALREGAVAATVLCRLAPDLAREAATFGALALAGATRLEAGLAATARPRAEADATFLTFGCGRDVDFALVFKVCDCSVLFEPALVLVDLSFFLADDIRGTPFLFRFGDGTHSGVALMHIATRRVSTRSTRG